MEWKIGTGRKYSVEGTDICTDVKAFVETWVGNLSKAIWGAIYDVRDGLYTSKWRLDGFLNVSSKS